MYMKLIREELDVCEYEIMILRELKDFVILETQYAADSWKQVNKLSLTWKDALTWMDLLYWDIFP